MSPLQAEIARKSRLVRNGMLVMLVVWVSVLVGLVPIKSHTTVPKCGPVSSAPASNAEAAR